MSCSDCLTEKKNIEMGVASLHKQAKELAIKENCNVYIYHTEEGLAYMVEEAAIQNGIQPTAGVVSPLRPVTV